MKIYTLPSKDQAAGYEWQYWYDRSSACWYAGRFDPDGNQLDEECMFCYRKDEILKCIEIEEGGVK